MIFEETFYSKIRVAQVKGRYVTNDHIFDFLDSLNTSFEIDVVGSSVNRLPIRSVTLGNGPKRVLMWSQMHGNESTTTKAVLDLMNFLSISKKESDFLLRECTLKIIPILNPDGAKAYTRVNANQIDLNRDAQDLSQPESIVLRNIYDEFHPHYCFNLHDQRTIFNVGSTNKPATVSFLAPAFDVDRNISESRKKSMLLISAMNRTLQSLIPGQVGRYDDAFNANCVGDAFQMEQTPTLLFEAGHFPEDYQREKTREYIFHALLKGVSTIAKNKVSEYKIEEYNAIPENRKLFFDILIINAGILDESIKKTDRIGILYQEVLEGDTIAFKPTIAKRPLEEIGSYGHKTLDCTLKEDVLWLKEKGIMKLLN